jgi:subtilisin family serine protease
MKYFITTIVSLVLMTNVAWSEPSVRLLSERHRTEWNWIEYRISVTNTTSTPIQNPEVRYFAENTWIQYCNNPQHAAQCASIGNPAEATDSLLKVDVDYASRLNPVHKTVSTAGKVTAVKLKFTGALNPGKTLKVNFRIHKSDWSTWSAANDWSYQKSSGVSEPNYFFAVYDSDGNILWGDDPLTGKANSDVEVWHDRGGNSVVTKYDGNASEVQKAGRFWMLKDVPMNGKEAGLLEQAGVTRLSASAWGEKTLILMKSNANVKKRKLDSLVYGFYNSFSVDDSTRLKVEFKPEDWTERQMVCDSQGSCHEEITNLQSVRMSNRCWDDIAMDSCKRIVDECGGTNTAINNYVVISKNTKEAINCLANNRNIYSLNVVRDEPVQNDYGRSAINIENLQVNEWRRWNIDFTGFNDNVETSWLRDASGKPLKYTGENIVVGVYDTGIYYDHDGMIEWEGGKPKARRAYGDKDPIENGSNGDDDDYFHATHVAGIIGGNGNGIESPNHMYRGVAPKVKFYSNGSSASYPQRGHVVNHSHVGGYETNTEKAIFKNWKDSEDPKPKTFVVAAGNYALGDYRVDEDGKEKKCNYGRGYHSISFDTKNGIVVGNYASRTKIPNTNSSLGPTWDGRIKPDVMAPGSGFQGSFDANNKFEVYLDEITFERLGLTYKFGKLSHADGGKISGCLVPGSVLSNKKYIEDMEKADNDGKAALNGALCNYVREQWYQSINIVSDNKSLNDKVLLISDGYPLRSGIYVNWDHRTFRNTPFDVKRGDHIKIRMRIPAHIRSFFRVMRGNLYLAEGVDFYYSEKKHKHVDFEWNLGDGGDGYFETDVEWKEDDVLSNYLRIGFNFDYGVFSSEPCNRSTKGTCYKDEEGTSMAAPYVAGIAALMNQAYMEMIDDNESYTKSLRNSTSKAILIHTADDMIDENGFARTKIFDVEASSYNVQTSSGLSVPFTYGKGPDFVTGWGAVNAEKALDMFDFYNDYTNEFDKFKEFEIAGNVYKKWIIRVDRLINRLRTTLVWDDAPGDEKLTKMDEKLQNDLDLYLISPSGKYYFPWRLNPLSTEHINEKGEVTDECSNGTENISLEESLRPAQNECGDGTILYYSCFDHLNNVEVVDVDFPELGDWVVVAYGRKVVQGQRVSEDKHQLQTASIVSDFPLEDNPGNIGCDISHPYLPQTSLTCTYNFGNSLTNFVTFSNRTFVGTGDKIELKDEKDKLIGEYTGSQLAGVRLKVDSRKLTVRLESSNNELNKNNYGFSIDRIEMIPYPMLFGISH